MRNIALLEWGPASLFYIKPREFIKVRTEWLEGGPVLPQFLEADSAGVIKGGDLTVRYALSAFEDLNGAIKNLRLCFGFPYSEYIGFLNTMTRKHRARREHEAFIDRLRRWATFNIVDAVVWIDYAKSNQPPGSFKVGPHNSVPFSKAHIQVCTDVAIVKRKPNQDEESEPPWSDPEEDQNHHDTMLVPSMSTHAGPIATSGAMVLGTTVAAPGGTTISISDGIRRARRQQMAPHAPTPRRVGQPPAPPQKATPRRARLSDDEGSDVSDTPREGHDSALADKQADGPKQRSALLLLQEKTMLRHMIQEEVIPAHGSIYPRTLTPGPGYYGVPDVAPPAAASFGRRRKGCIDAAVDAHRMVPDPGTYEPKPAMSSGKKSLGMFDKAYVSTLMTPADTTRKLPFISNGSSLREAPGVHSPPTFHPIMPEATSRTQHHPSGSSWGFGSLRRPF